jgi:hypothetical protein
MSRQRRVGLAACALVALAGLAYLRDPAWLVSVESGFRPWETDRDGARYRWMAGHASFFVPSSARTISIPFRTTFSGRDDAPISLTISLDDRPADQLTLADGEWHRVTLSNLHPNHRRVRRVDIRADGMRKGNRSVQVGTVGIE